MKGCASPVSGPRHHFVALDSLRGVAACLVVLHHIPGEGLLIGSEFVRNGWLAVDFFFVLSGFIIAANYADRLACGFSQVQFWIYRLGRLWPLHAAVLAVSVMVEGSGLLFDSSALISRLPFTEGRSPDNLLFSAFLLQAWQGEGGNGWNVQSWSISVEVFLYLIFGLAWAWMGRAASALLALGVVVWATCFDLSGWLGNDLFARGLFGFASGLLVWEARLRLPRVFSRVQGRSLEVVAALAFILAMTAYAELGQAILGAVFAFVVLVFAGDTGHLSRLLARPFPVLLGTLSYSIYMVHALVVGRVFDALVLAGWLSGRAFVDRSAEARRLVAGVLASDLVALATLAVVIGLSVLSYRWIERPARVWSRHMGSQIGAARLATLT